MILRPCHNCNARNVVEVRHCVRCGAPLIFKTIVISPDDREPYRVEATEVVAPDLGHVRRAAALVAAAFAAEAALLYAERNGWAGRSLGSRHARRWRNGAFDALAGAALLFANQNFGTAAGRH